MVRRCASAPLAICALLALLGAVPAVAEQAQIRKVVSFVIGGQRGKGVLMVRQGVQSADIILFFRTRRSVDAVLQGNALADPPSATALRQAVASRETYK
jgi:lipid-binding SYLF domain-containing protein